jgi:hypothetical protein
MAKNSANTQTVGTANAAVVEPTNADKLISMLVPVDPNAVMDLVAELIKTTPVMGITNQASDICVKAKIARAHLDIDDKITDTEAKIESLECDILTIQAANKEVEDELFDCQRRVGNRRYQWEKAVRSDPLWKHHARLAKFVPASQEVIDNTALVIESRVNAECGNDVLRTYELEEALTVPHARVFALNSQVENRILQLREDAKASEVLSGKLEGEANKLLVANGWAPKDALMLCREMISA